VATHPDTWLELLPYLRTKVQLVFCLWSREHLTIFSHFTATCELVLSPPTL